MKKKPEAKQKQPKLTDAERHKRFVDTAREIGADERSEAFDRAFKNVVQGDRRKAPT